LSNHLSLARLLVSRKRPAAARKAFGRARSLLQDLAAGISEPALRDMFLQTQTAREVFARAL
jgi:hypothetical protein